MGRPLYFEELLNTLRAAPSNTSRDAEQNLYYELERAKPKFFQLFDLPPRNAKEKQDIEAGGRFVSKHLSVSNNLCKALQSFMGSPPFHISIKHSRTRRSSSPNNSTAQSCTALASSTTSRYSTSLEDAQKPRMLSLGCTTNAYSCWPACGTSSKPQ